MKELALAKVYQLLEPGPVVLLTTARKGCANVMTMSWHMMVEFEPLLVACMVGNADYGLRRCGRQRVPHRHSASMPCAKIADLGNCSGREVARFEKFGLTPLKAGRVAAPLIAGCFANIECKVVDSHLVNGRFAQR